jgi:hypothetical protein
MINEDFQDQQDNYFPKDRPCPCGSGKHSWILSDNRNISCGRVCDDCEEKVKSKYRPEIFQDGNYECEEQIDDDY